MISSWHKSYISYTHSRMKRVKSITRDAKPSIHTAAVSTPVGPPPHMTKLRRRLRSSGVVVGKEAASKLSMQALQYTHSARRKNPRADLSMQERTKDTTPNCLRIGDGLELETVLQSRNTMRAGYRPSGNDQLVIPIHTHHSRPQPAHQYGTWNVAEYHAKGTKGRDNKVKIG